MQTVSRIRSYMHLQNVRLAQMLSCKRLPCVNTKTFKLSSFGSTFQVIVDTVFIVYTLIIALVNRERFSMKLTFVQNWLMVLSIKFDKGTNGLLV